MRVKQRDKIIRENIAMAFLNDVHKMINFISLTREDFLLRYNYMSSLEYDITNDLRDTRGVIDLNFKNICATIKQEENGLSVLPEVEVWDDSGNLDFVVVDMYDYSKYNTSIRKDGKIQITSSHPYDEQEYHYVVGNNIYRNGKFIENTVNLLLTKYMLYYIIIR